MSSRTSGRNGPSRSARATDTEPPHLTQRELEVIEWIVAGKRNRDIGKIIECSPRTVQKHVQHILEKLYLETRTEVCVWWYERRLNRHRPPSPSRSRSLTRT